MRLSKLKFHLTFRDLSHLNSDTVKQKIYQTSFEKRQTNLFSFMNKFFQCPIILDLLQIRANILKSMSPRKNYSMGVSKRHLTPTRKNILESILCGFLKSQLLDFYSILLLKFASPPPTSLFRTYVDERLVL